MELVFSEEDKKFIEINKKLPKDIREYIAKLHWELWLCYEYMQANEKYAIVGNYFRDQESLHMHLNGLIRNIELEEMGRKAVAEAKKQEKK